MTNLLDTGMHQWVAGVDESGRGPLAGPVVVAAVILPRGCRIRGLDDSKRLPPEVREVLFTRIHHRAVSIAVRVVDVEEVERVNILVATLNGMRRSVVGLDPQPTLVMVDGDRLPTLQCEARAIIAGDRRVPAISAASIVAKVTRDRMMERWHREFPQYGFDRHKGYATPEHLENLRRFGPCPIHRRTFAPVRELLAPPLPGEW